MHNIHRPASFVLTSNSAVLLLLGIAISARIVMVVLPLFFELGRFGSPSQDGYWQIAQSLAHYNLFSLDGQVPTTGRAPLLPLLLAPGMWAGCPYLWAGLLQIALGAAACLVVFKTILLLHAPVKVALFHSLILAIYPSFIWMTKNAMPYVLCTLLVALICYTLATIYIDKRFSYRYYLLLGILNALLALAHPSYLPAIAGLAAALALILLRHKRSAKNIAQALAVMVTTFTLLIFPWTVRNYLVTERFIPIVQGFGFQYVLGSDIADRMMETGMMPWQASFDFQKAADLLNASLKDLDLKYYVLDNDLLNQALDSMAVNEMKEMAFKQPIYFIKRMAVNLLSFWFADLNWPLSIMQTVFKLPLFLYISYAIITSRRLWEIAVFSLPFIPTVLIHSVIQGYVGHTAYSIPLMATLLIITAIAHQLRREKNEEEQGREVPESIEGNAFHRSTLA